MTDQYFQAISPLDGRYENDTRVLEPYTTEAGLNSYRVLVEVRWLQWIVAHTMVGEGLNDRDRAILSAWKLPPRSDLKEVKTRELTTNHDVKAVEYFLRAQLETAGASPRVLSLVHVACTSEDINNLAYALLLRDLRAHVLVPAMTRVTKALQTIVQAHSTTAMVGRTHGQIATPTTLGKELAVFVHRLQRQTNDLVALPIDGKFNGAVGNFNAHRIAYPEIDWPAVSKAFVTSLGLQYNPLTTQIESHDGLAAYCDGLKRYATVALGLCRDIWGYVSLGYFTQALVEHETGSSTMPHKINPIDFENAEGNFGLAIALAEHFATKLPISRWQRDLSDSTVLRSLGSMHGYAIVALASLDRGLGKLQVDTAAIAADLDDAWEVLAEPVQTVMRRYGITDAYERVKHATRGQRVTRASIAALIDACPEVPPEVRARLKSLTPALYVGYAAELALQVVP